jgi:hypothetical protein
VRIFAAGTGAYLSAVLGSEAGATTAQTLSEIGEALVGFLAGREERRIARTLGRVNQEVVRRVDAGEVVKEEIADPQGEGSAEIFESVVEAAARSIEERKCDVIANLYVSIAFDRSVSIDDALLYLRRVRASSWRQLVALRYFEDEDRRAEREMIGMAGAEGDARIHPVLGIELSELAGRGLEFIGIGQEGGAVADPASTFGGGTITSRSVSRIRATGLGETVSRLGKIAEVVTEAELDEIARDLRSDQRLD